MTTFDSTTWMTLLGKWTFSVIVGSHESVLTRIVGIAWDYNGLVVRVSYES